MNPDEFARLGATVLSYAVLGIVSDGHWYTVSNVREALFPDAQSADTAEHRLVHAILWHLVDDEILVHEGNSYRLAAVAD